MGNDRYSDWERSFSDWLDEEESDDRTRRPGPRPAGSPDHARGTNPTNPTDPARRPRPAGSTDSAGRPDGPRRGRARGTARVGAGAPPARRHRGVRRRRSRLRRAVLAGVTALAVLVGGGAATAAILADRFNNAIHRSDLLGSARTKHGADVRGPLNFLLIGSNFRSDNPSNGERADVTMIVHVTKDLRHAFLVSVPRDLYYTIKPDPRIAPHYRGSTEKIDAALNYGGMPLMTETVHDLTGVRFDGAVMSRFDGFKQAVQTLGGVNMCVDEETTSVHIGHTADGKYAKPYSNTGGHPIPVPGVTPKVYHKGCQHLSPSDALDFVRQRELLPGGDYDRQRHSQQFIAAVLKQTASAGTLSNPVKLDKVLHEIGSSMTVDTNGYSLTDLAYALRGIDSADLTGLKAPSHPQDIDGTSYVVADPGMDQLWQAIRDDTLAAWAKAHPTMVNQLHPTGH